MAFADYLTTEGKRMMAKAALGYKISCTKLVMGSSMMSANQEASTMSGVITPVIELPIDEVYMNGDDAIVMSAQFSNEDISTGFYFREKGVYMSDGNIEVLAIYANAGYDAEYIDVASKSVIVKKRIRTVMTVTSDELVNIQIVNGDYASAYVIATESTLAEYIASHDLTEFKPGQSVIVGGKKYTFIGTDPKRESDYVLVPILSDEYEKLEGNAADGIGASQAALYNCYTQMKKSFQAGVDTIYNAFVAVGTTPESITPDDIAETVPKLIDGTAKASHVLKGKSFSANGEVGVVGTMPDLSGTTADASSVTSDDDFVYATPQAGYYDTSSMIRVPKEGLGGGEMTCQKIVYEMVGSDAYVSKSFTMPVSANNAILVYSAGTPTGCVITQNDTKIVNNSSLYNPQILELGAVDEGTVFTATFTGTHEGWSSVFGCALLFYV